ncbi:transcriptional regulator, LacI family [Loktanella fryxellensis]|uniref:Transcriptional regulator, LacI family n=1 Tax=Loktanella fryxellensis TaxID=245187 RepID=A0A1H8CUM6_9RHOB|nr:LacI family DNA-binding transcriptional regulator [Loktanella fryxellensis]SEM98823.1 transcriptional regulator, LacI family [Loktanella fryxellensis]
MEKTTPPDGKKPQIATMEALSVAIGVSRPTLSRYFQDPASVSRSSVDRIREGLERVEYVPNFFATRMNRKSTGMIGVIIPYLNDLFFTRLLEAIEIAAMEAGFTVISQCSHSDPAIEARAVETFMSMNVDGALVVPLGNQSDLDACKRLNARLPLVLVDSRPKPLSELDFIGTDHVQSTGLMTEYLCRVGAPPVFLAMPRVNFNAVERENAYLSKMHELGHAPMVIGTDSLNEDGHFEAHGQVVLAEQFARGALVDATILAVNDRVALGALRAAWQYGLQPGALRHGGLRIAGHDDFPLCDYTTPRITTVSQNVDAIGRAAVARLTDRIRAENKADGQIVQLFDGVLKVRESA